ncbi:unnamed protein product, partial [Prorocentrum cordatum]
HSRSPCWGRLRSPRPLSGVFLHSFCFSEGGMVPIMLPFPRFPLFGPPGRPSSPLLDSPRRSRRNAPLERSGSSGMVSAPFDLPSLGWSSPQASGDSCFGSCGHVDGLFPPAAMARRGNCGRGARCFVQAVLLQAALHSSRALPGAEASMQKGLGLCLGGEVRQVCSSMDMASWRLVVEQFSSFEVLGVTTGDGCATLQQQLEASLPDGMPQVGCYGRDGVAELFEARVQRFAERGWQFRNASHLGPPPADGHLRADGSYHFRSAFFQAYQRLQCAAWVRGRQEQGVQFKWVMFARLDVEWRSFPAERELEHHLPVLWLQHRSVNFLQPVPSDRMHVGRSEVILPLLERLFDFLMDLEALVERWGESLAFATCLGRPGKARFTCPPDYGPEDLVELFLLFASMPARIHPEICFDMRSSRHHSERCGQAIENNCRAQATDPQAGYVVAPRRRAYTHAYSQGDEYDSLLAIKLDQILALDADRLGFDMQAVDVGAGVGTYVSLLRQLGADICGLDGRRDLSDSLGEDAIIHDISLPLPRVLVYRFHWVFCFNMLEHLPASWSITELRQVVLNLADLAAVGVLITVPENAYVAGPSADAEPLEVEYVVDRGLQDGRLLPRRSPGGGDLPGGGPAVLPRPAPQALRLPPRRGPRERGGAPGADGEHAAARQRRDAAAPRGGRRRGVPPGPLRRAGSAARGPERWAEGKGPARGHRGGLAGPAGAAAGPRLGHGGARRRRRYRCRHPSPSSPCWASLEALVATAGHRFEVLVRAHPRGGPGGSGMCFAPRIATRGRCGC